MTKQDVCLTFKEMARVSKTYRIHPLLVKVVESKAEDLESTAAYIVECALSEMFKHELPPGFQPGLRMKDE